MGLSPHFGFGGYNGPSKPVCGVETPPSVPEDEHEPTEDRGARYNLLGKVAGLLQRSLSRSREGSATEVGSDTDSPTSPRTGSWQTSRKTLRPSTALPSPPRETKQVYLEYDPVSKRRVLNTYEILNDIGKGEHGKVKLARDLVHNELVAIKIVNRNSKDRPLLRMRRFSRPQFQANEYGTKIKREIAIMKRCNHRHIVRLLEVLDDMNSKKIYLVLEYLEKGEIKWKRKLDALPPCEPTDEIPCCGSRGHLLSYTMDDEDQDLLSNTFSPNLTFKQSRKIFRDVLLGLEYLHMLGIVHRDVKPANLLVSSDNIVKISDFGVSFALFLNGPDNSLNELELAKTAGTPAFFAPELCQTNFLSANSSKSVSASSLEILKGEEIASRVLPRIDHKIDIWALGVTLYCLLFGKVPFNADSEFELFLVIVNQPLEFPPDRHSFNSRVEISELEFDLAKDLLNKLLDKNKDTRIDIPEIKQHPFVLMDLATDMDQLNDFIYMNAALDSSNPDSLVASLEKSFDILDDEVNNAVVGLGSHIRKSVAAAIKAGSNNYEYMSRFESPSDDSQGNSQAGSQFGSQVGFRSMSHDHSIIFSEALQTSTPPPQEMGRTISNAEYTSAPHFPSGLSNEINGVADCMSSSPSAQNSATNLPRKGSNILVQDLIDSETRSRRNSSTGTEASQIETKRNATGDVYLKNQSLLDTFKDIKLQDDKRRRSSAYLSSSQSGSRKGSTTPKPTKEKNSVASPIPVPQQKRLTGTFLNVDANAGNNRDPSSVISLPLSDSLASLDSLNDDYVTRKYKELSQKNTGRRVSVSGRDRDGLFSESDIPNIDVAGINEKFLKFNLDTLMSITSRLGRKNEDDIAPNTVPRTVNSSQQSSSSCCSSSASSSSFVSDSDEDGDLTLAFSSKVAPSVRPPFLSLSNRAKSHDSKLPSYNLSSAIHQEDAVILQDDMPEFEDLPAGLLSNIPRPSISGSGLLLMAPTVSVISGTSENTLSPTRQLPANTPSLSSTVQSFAHDAQRIREAKPRVAAGLRENIFHNQYNNHYKKDPISYPFPNAVHYENDRETEDKSSTRKSGDLRPNNYRSNSVTVGLLQHQLQQVDEDRN